jgi:hypothetical protein
MKLSEIERVKPHNAEWNPNQESKKITGIKSIKGYPSYGYAQNKVNSLNLTGYNTEVNFYDISDSGSNPKLIGFITFRKYQLGNLRNCVQVTNTAIAAQYRGQGLGLIMYLGVLQAGFIIVADESQTPQAASMWARMSQTPGIEVRGHTAFMKDDIVKKRGMDEWELEDVQENLAKIKKMNAVPMTSISTARSSDFVDFSFPVAPGKTKELAGKGIKIYKTRKRNDYYSMDDYSPTIGLYARWVG